MAALFKLQTDSAGKHNNIESISMWAVGECKLKCGTLALRQTESFQKGTTTAITEQRWNSKYGNSDRRTQKDLTWNSTTCLCVFTFNGRGKN